MKGYEIIIGWVFGMALSIVLSLLLLGGSVFLVVKILQWMNVI